jgi:hypothetical protein
MGYLPVAMLPGKPFVKEPYSLLAIADGRIPATDSRLLTLL